jgi:tetratricopeptide (TPR) repeat protein
VDALRRLTEEQPSYQPVLVQLGYLLNETGKPDAALAYLRRALALDAESPRVLCEAARALAALGEATAARGHLERALAINPSYPLAWKRLLLLLAGQPGPDAREWADRAMAAHPGSYLLALAGLPLLPEDEALPRLARLIEVHAPALSGEERASAVAAFSQAVLQAVAARLDTPDALQLLRQAVQAFPESGRVAALLGEALDRAGRREEAQVSYARALALGRQAEIALREFAPEDPLLRRCLIAGYARQWSAPAP